MRLVTVCMRHRAWRLWRLSTVVQRPSNILGTTFSPGEPVTAPFLSLPITSTARPALKPMSAISVGPARQLQHLTTYFTKPGSFTPGAPRPLWFRYPIASHYYQLATAVHRCNTLLCALLNTTFSFAYFPQRLWMDEMFERLQPKNPRCKWLKRSGMPLKRPETQVASRIYAA